MGLIVFIGRGGMGRKGEDGGEADDVLVSELEKAEARHAPYATTKKKEKSKQILKRGHVRLLPPSNAFLFEAEAVQ